MPKNQNRDEQGIENRQPQSSGQGGYQRMSEDRDEEGRDSELEDREPQSSSDQSSGKLRNQKQGSNLEEESGRDVQSAGGDLSDDDELEDESEDSEDSQGAIGVSSRGRGAEAPRPDDRNDGKPDEAMPGFDGNRK
jgi:hypothetical protein